MKLPTNVWRNWRLTTAKDFFVTKASLPRMTAMTDHKRSMRCSHVSRQKVAKQCTRNKGILTGLKIPPVTTHAQNLPSWAGRKTNFEMLWARPNAGRGSLVQVLPCEQPATISKPSNFTSTDTVRNSPSGCGRKTSTVRGRGGAKYFRQSSSSS